MWCLLLFILGFGLLAGFVGGIQFMRWANAPPPVHPRSVVARSQAEQEAERIIEQLL